MVHLLMQRLQPTTSRRRAFIIRCSTHSINRDDWNNEENYGAHCWMVGSARGYPDLLPRALSSTFVRNGNISWLGSQFHMGRLFGGRECITINLAGNPHSNLSQLTPNTSKHQQQLSTMCTHHDCRHPLRHYLLSPHHSRTPLDSLSNANITIITWKNKSTFPQRR